MSPKRYHVIRTSASTIATMSPTMQAPRKLPSRAMVRKSTAKIASPMLVKIVPFTTTNPSEKMNVKVYAVASMIGYLLAMSRAASIWSIR